MPEWAHATTSDGVRLALRRFRPAGAPRGVVLCTHAMWANGSSQLRFAAAAAEAGLDCWVLDFRGHGASVPPSPRVGGWNFDDYVERDLPAALEAVARGSGAAPGQVAYLGHSLGGLVGLAAFGTGSAPQPRRLVLVSVSCWRHGPRGPLARRAGMALFDLSARAFGRAPIRALGLGTDDEPESYVRQLTGWTRAGLWSSLTGHDYASTIPSITSPTLATVSDDDPLCTAVDAHDLIDRLSALPQVIHLPGNHFALFSRAGAACWPQVIDFVAAQPARST
jgi:predicted alpha/beta hydrolase